MQTACSHAETCALKDRCVDAYRTFLKSLNDITSAQAALSTAPTQAAESLAAAQRALDEAQKKTLECAAAQGELARRYRL